MTLKADRNQKHPPVFIWLKVFVFALPAAIAPHIIPSYGHRAFGLSLVLGVLLQGLIPPRKNGLLLLLVLAVLFTLLPLGFLGL